jgi:hypothetical protein
METTVRDLANLLSATRFCVFGFAHSIVSKTSVMESFVYPFVKDFLASMRPSILPLFRILFVNSLVSTPYIAGTPSSFSHVPRDDVARKWE